MKWFLVCETPMYLFKFLLVRVGITIIICEEGTGNQIEFIDSRSTVRHFLLMEGSEYILSYIKLRSFGSVCKTSFLPLH